MPASKHSSICKSFQKHGIGIADPADVEEFKLFGAFAAPSSCDNLTDWQCKLCLKYPASQGTVVHAHIAHSEQGMHAYIATNVNYPAIIVAFRGTMDSKDYKVDAEFRMVPFKDEIVLQDNHGKPKVHRGFLNAWDSASTEIIETVEHLLDDGHETIWVTGHSLGGALAGIAGLVLAAHFPNVKVVIRALEPPRAGNTDFASLFREFTNLDYRRTVHSRDPIPHLLAHMLGYRHVGLEYWIPRKDGPMVKCRDMKDEDDECSRRIDNTLVSNASNLHIDLMGMAFTLCK